LLKSAGIYFAVRVVAALCGLLAVAIYTRLASPEAYGVFTLVMTGAMTVFAVCFHWIQSAVHRYLPAEDGERPRALGAALAGFLVVSVIVAAAAAAIIVAAPFGVQSDLVALAAAIAWTYAGLEIALAVVHARQKPTLYGIMLAGRALGSLAFGSLFLLAGYGALGLLVGVLIAHAIPVCALALKHRHRLMAQRPDVAAVKRMASFGLPLAVVAIAASIIGISDRYLLAALVGVDAAGVYAAPYDLAQRTLQIVMLSAFLAVSPVVFRTFELGQHEQFRAHLMQQARLLLVTAVPVATILAAGAPLAARLLFGVEFRDAAAMLIPWIVMATLVQGIQSYYFSYCFTLANRTLMNAAVVSIGAALNIVLNLVLIPSYGPLGAAIATLASFVVVLAVAVYFTRRWLVLPWPTVDMLKVGGVCLIAAPLIGVAARLPGLPEALFCTGAATCLLGGLLLLTNAASSRRIGVELLGSMRRRLGGGMVAQS
jgi:O-antigen/teichoic acid export membrane protein